LQPGSRVADLQADVKAEERVMGLPAGQQRVLDSIEEALGTAEPRLTAMYAIFTRLTGNEARPHREQLPSARGWRSWPVRLRPALSRRRRRSHSRPWQPDVLACQGGKSARPFRRVLMLGQLTAILMMLGLLIGITATTMRPAACASSLWARHTTTHAPAATCQRITSVGK
jgi:hypothetical protein